MPLPCLQQLALSEYTTRIQYTQSSWDNPRSAIRKISFSSFPQVHYSNNHALVQFAASFWSDSLKTWGVDLNSIFYVLHSWCTKPFFFNNTCFARSYPSPGTSLSMKYFFPFSFSKKQFHSRNHSLECLERECVIWTKCSIMFQRVISKRCIKNWSWNPSIY